MTKIQETTNKDNVTTKTSIIKKTKNGIKKEDSRLKSSDSNFITDYIRTGDEVASAMTAYSLPFEAASVKASIMLRDTLVLDLIKKEMDKCMPDTSDKAYMEAWQLYKKCKLEGNKIKAFELFAKMKGYLKENVVNNNYQSWNVLISNAQRQKELAEMAPITLTDVTPSTPEAK